MSSRWRTVVVTGATGRQGGAVARHLLRAGWGVRAVTRSPQGSKAQGLADLGAEVVWGDLNEPSSLPSLLVGAYGLYSVQTPYPSGIGVEVRQGKALADAAAAAGVEHVVYGSAGPGVPGTGVPSWESKLVIEEHMRGLGLPLTVLRPMAFMELMTDRQFFPAVAAWHVMPRLVGESRELPWLCVDDLGAIAARVFAEPDLYLGKELKLASDLKSLGDCRRLYRSVVGREPPRFRMPVWVFERFGFMGDDLSRMWRWLREGRLGVDPEVSLAIHPGARNVEQWLRSRGNVTVRRKRSLA